MNIQIVMDHSGDNRHSFDPTDRAAVTVATQRFKALVGQGHLAAKRTKSGTCEVIKAFDPTIKETLFIPRLVGG
jgi:hypothetical protein